MLRRRSTGSLDGNVFLASFGWSMAFLAAATVLPGCTSKCQPGRVLKDGLCTLASNQQSGAVTEAAMGSAGNASSATGNETAAAQNSVTSGASSFGQAGEQSQAPISAQGPAGSTPASDPAGIAGAQSSASASPTPASSSGSAGSVGAAASGTAATQGPCPNGAEPADETCDNRDEDCDGVIDEGLVMACGSSARPPCMMGTQTCEAGEWGACVDAIDPSDEVCDADRVDEDCDGNINEGCDCVPGDVMQCGVTKGACREGMQTCSAEGKFDAECLGEVGPKTEVCDGRADDDCDGRADADDTDCECVNGEKEECQTAGIGVCSRGQKTCTNGKWARCVANETGCVCDDSQAPRQCGSSDTGSCKFGTQSCEQGQWAACAGDVGPAPEKCDGADTDCDGIADASDDDACPSGEQCTGSKCESNAPPTSSSPYKSCTSDNDCAASRGICSNASSPNFCAPSPAGGCPPAPNGAATGLFFDGAGCVIVCRSDNDCPSEVPFCFPNPFAGNSQSGEPDRFCVPKR
jgi:hypothetical protein